MRISLARLQVIPIVAEPQWFGPIGVLRKTTDSYGRGDGQMVHPTSQHVRLTQFRHE